jgi:predicted transcriptional regulator
MRKLSRTELPHEETVRDREGDVVFFMREIDEIDIDIIKAVEEYSPITLSELSRMLNRSKSMIWRRVTKLARIGLLNLIKQGGTLIILKSPSERPVRLLKVGILRASEYPYIIKFSKSLSDLYDVVDIIVYDEALKLALDLASGKLHLGLAPVPSLFLAHRVSLGKVKIIGGGSAGGSGIIEGKGEKGHATTAASTMELCAEIKKLEPPRLYINNGVEILKAVEKGRAKYGVLWEPYLTLAERKGLKVERCHTPFCCLLGAHESVFENSEKIKRLFSNAVSTARSSDIDLDAYSDLVSLPSVLVKRTVKFYEFLEEPPVDEIKKLWRVITSVVMPKDIVLKEAFQ